MDLAHPHDSLFRFVFGEPRDAATLLATALPAPLADAIDWTRLERVDGSFVDANAEAARSDLLFSAPLGNQRVLLYLLLEHKSHTARLTVFQVLRYVVRILERHLATHPDARALPPVLPIVFHHGGRPWRAPVSLRPLLDVGNVPPDLRRLVLRHQPHLRLVLDDVTAQSDAVLEQRRLSLVARVSILFLKHLRRGKPADLERHLLRCRDLLARLLAAERGSDILTALCFYAAATTDSAPTDVHAAVSKALEPTTATAIMNKMQKYILTERNAGRAEGKVEGKAEGKAEGRAELLLRMLRRRFGALAPEVELRVAQATIAELDDWADRILDARSLADMFAPR